MEIDEVEVDGFNDVPDLQIARLERMVDRLAANAVRQQEEITLLCGILMGLHDDEAEAG